MWYFAWVLGIGVAVMAGLINALWLDAHLERANRKQ